MAPTKSVLTGREVQRTVALYKRRLKKVGVPFTALYLFGSYAKKKQRPWSDIDIAVVSRKFGKDFVKESVLLNRVADEIHPLIQAHPLHPKTLRDPYSTFAYEIQTHGQRA